MYQSSREVETPAFETIIIRRLCIGYLSSLVRCMNDAD